jgi:hypothetical protein
LLLADVPQTEEAIGFSIARNDSYPLNWGYVYIQPPIGLEAQPPRTATAIYDVGDQAVYLMTAPLIKWPDGALQQGTQMTIGGRAGWLIRANELGLIFAFPCGSSADFGGVWCRVEAERNSLPDIEPFVTGISSG